MAILSDFHLHSFFSADSDTPMEDQVRAAIKAGLSSICFTEHFDPDWPYANTPKEDLGAPFSVDMKAYLAELSRMRELYGDQIRIFSGIEVGLAEGFEEETLSFVNDHRELDFLIGSVHSCHHGDPYYPDFFAMVQRYDFFQSLGHLDYVLRYAIQQEDPELLSFLNRKGQSYGSYCFAANRDVIEEILRILIARGTALEVNTQAIAKAAGADSSDLSIYREICPSTGRPIPGGIPFFSTVSLAGEKSPSVPTPICRKASGRALTRQRLCFALVVLTAIPPLRKKPPWSIRYDDLYQSRRHPTGTILTPFAVVYPIGAFAHLSIRAFRKRSSIFSASGICSFPVLISMREYLPSSP